MHFKELLKALWSDREVFATGGEIDGSSFQMPSSLLVEGAGNVELPLSQEGLDKLKAVSQQAPYGLGERTVVDTDVRRAWQINPGRISCPENPRFFSSVAQELAAAGLAAMGLDSKALELDARPYKLLLYEAGGHFKFHRDTEKEAGMFATMIVQLPTASGHTGGALTVRQGRQCSRFDFSEGSSGRCFSTIFFCDCEHQLEEVASGSRLCLVFSLVRNNVDFIPAGTVPSFVSALPRVRALLQQWAESGDGAAAQSGDESGDGAAMETQQDYRQRNERRFVRDRKLLVIPLAHKYSKTSLSFAGLKGHDRVVAALVRACEFLDLHLCMLTKHKTVTDYFQNEYVIDNWLSIDDQPAKFKQWHIDFTRQVLRCAPPPAGMIMEDEEAEGEVEDQRNERDVFDFIEDEFRGTEMMAGNEGGSEQYFYHVAALVVWPKVARSSTICPSLGDISWVLEWLREIYGDEFAAMEEPRRFLEEAVDGLTRKFASVAPWGQTRQNDMHWRLARNLSKNFQELYREPAMLLELCVKSGLRESAFAILRTWVAELISLDEFARAVHAYGWEACREIVETALVGVFHSGFLPWKLHRCGCNDGAVAAAKLLCRSVATSEQPQYGPAPWQSMVRRFGRDSQGFQPEGGVQSLLDFCLTNGLRDEASQILGKVPLAVLSFRMMAMVVHHFPERMKEVEVLWEEQRVAVSSSDPSSRDAKASEMRFIGGILEFALQLEALGHLEAARAFAAKSLQLPGFPEKAEQYQPWRQWLDEPDVMLLMLLDKPENLRVRTSEHCRGEVVRAMLRAGRLMGLKDKAEMKRLFCELCKVELAEVMDKAELNSWAGDPSPLNQKGEKIRQFTTWKNYMTWAEQKEFLEMALFWLEDEGVLERVVELASKRMNMVKRMVEEGFVEKAIASGMVGSRHAMRRLVEARMEYLAREPSMDDVEGDFLPPASKVMRICGAVDARQLEDNPRQLRRAHEIVVEKWRAICKDEMESLRALREIL